MKHIFIIKQQYIRLFHNLASNIFTFCFDHDYDFQIVEAVTDLDVQEIAKKHKMEDAIIYAVGNDEDLHLVLNAIVGGKAKLGIIPIGKYNDFYLSLNCYLSDTVLTNAMKVNDSYGLNFFSVGLQAKMASANDMLDSLMSLLKCRNEVMGVNNYFEKMLSLAFFNGAFYHGRKVSCANIHDDILRIIMTGYMNKLESWILFAEFLLGRHEKNPQVTILTTDEDIYVEGMKSLPGYLDGEVMKANGYLIVPHAKEITVVNNRPLIRELKK